MLCFFFLFFNSTLFAQSINTPSTLSVMPVPASVQITSGRLLLDTRFSVETQGDNSDRLHSAVRRAVERIEERSGLTLSECRGKDCRGTLLVVADTPGEKIQSTKEDESYSLDINSERAMLHAHSVVGAMRGLETFVQTLDADRDGFFWPALKIEDNPRFAWRGLLVDPARHWLSLDLIKRMLDAMAVVKLNVLHWHLSDDQGFRVESHIFPLLHKMGSNGQYYRQSEIREIVAYAHDRGIRIVPEFDMPGHAHSWFIGYPKLASAPGPYKFKYYLGGDSAPMDPTKEATYIFIDKFVGEMSALFPDQYWHIGGDEVDGTPWLANPAIQAFEKQHGIKDNAALQVYFNQRLSRILRKHGKKMMGWDEVINPDLPKNTVVQSWQGAESLALTAKQGYDSILSAPYYLDKMFPTSTYYAGDPLPAQTNLNASEAAHVIGGEVCMWAEYVSSENVDSRIWPRTAAIAERFWSPQEVKNVASMYQRLEVVSRNLDFLGLTHNTNYHKMLERLAGADPVEPVKVLADVLEPAPLGPRTRTHKYTQQFPLNRLVDAARPDSQVAREFAGRVEAQDRPVIKTWLTLWRDNDARLRPALEKSALLAEDVAVSRDLSQLGSVGLQALDFIERKKRPPAAWMEEQRKYLDSVKKLRLELSIAIVPSIQKLVEQAGEPAAEPRP